MIFQQKAHYCRCVDIHHRYTHTLYTRCSPKPPNYFGNEKPGGSITKQLKRCLQSCFSWWLDDGAVNNRSIAGCSSCQGRGIEPNRFQRQLDQHFLRDLSGEKSLSRLKTRCCQDGLSKLKMHWCNFLCFFGSFLPVKASGSSTRCLQRRSLPLQSRSREWCLDSPWYSEYRPSG